MASSSSIGFAASVGGLAGASLAAHRGMRAAAGAALAGAVALGMSEAVARARQKEGEIPALWQRIAVSTAHVQRGAIQMGDGLSGSAYGFGEANNLFHRLTLHVQGHQQGGNLSITGLAGENLRHHRPRFLAAQIDAMMGDLMESVCDHWKYTILT